LKNGCCQIVHISRKTSLKIDFLAAKIGFTASEQLETQKFTLDLKDKVFTCGSLFAFAFFKEPKAAFQPQGLFIDCDPRALLNHCYFACPIVLLCFFIKIKALFQSFPQGTTLKEDKYYLEGKVLPDFPCLLTL